jgi:DNA mismatch repair protein MutS
MMQEDAAQNSRLTPMLRQFREVKAQYPDAIVFFRMGDFFEMFFQDAEEAARILEITLTSRDKNKENAVPMCGVPVAAADAYLAKLVQAGRRVAVCDQVEDPRTAKGLVRREVVRVVSPGLVTADTCLSAKENNFIAAVSQGPMGQPFGLAFLDLSTGEFRIAELKESQALLAEIFRIEPSELLLPMFLKGSQVVLSIQQVLPRVFLSFRPDEFFDVKRGLKEILSHFRIVDLQGLGLQGMREGVGAGAGLLAYVMETQKGLADHLKPPVLHSVHDFLFIDEAAKRNLELVRNCLDGGRSGTLLDVLDKTMTPMGGRLLRQWVLYPLQEIKAIEARSHAISTLREHSAILDDLRRLLKGVYDLERLMSRISMATAGGRDLLAFKQSIGILPELKSLVHSLREKASNPSIFQQILCSVHDVSHLFELLEKGIREDCPATLRDGGVIKDGYSPELDELFSIQRNARGLLAALERAERERTGISALKVGYNRVFGYYIEVSRANSSRIPADYQRKQTLVNGERYITQELKGLEDRILGAEERRLELETALFEEIRMRIAADTQKILEIASAVAVLDCLCSLARVAEDNGYICPVVREGQAIVIREGRHPVVEQSLPRGAFVPNDLSIGAENARMILLTGPNMAGKSTVLRQTALLALMAQMGGHVPARQAEFGVVDRIFSRVGATDYLFRGQSTFMVEMIEAANILNNATERSLVILDEIGRGTSTYDGLSIAWAMAESLLNKAGKGVKTLFATHYYEMTALANWYAGVQNWHVAVEEWQGEIVFLHRLQAGPAQRSYGIQVAALAGVPRDVIERAMELLDWLESGKSKEKAHMPCPVTGTGSAQAPAVVQGRKRSGQKRSPIGVQAVLPLDAGEFLKKRLSEVDINQITPIDALNLLAELKKLMD